MRFSNSINTIVTIVTLVVSTHALNYNVSLNSQTHLAYAGPHVMMVSWNTYNQIAKPTVKYGFTPSNLTSKLLRQFP
jgi:hypothetical protein